MKSLKIDNEYFRKKYKSLIKRKILTFNTEIVIESALTITSNTLAKLNPSVGVVISSSRTLLTSIAILITSENISNQEIGYTKLRDWINVITFSYEHTFNTYIVDKNLMRKNLRVENVLKPLS